jgi:hypothetical protein
MHMRIHIQCSVACIKPVSVSVPVPEGGRGRGTMCSSMGSVESRDMQLAGDFMPGKEGRG